MFLMFGFRLKNTWENRVFGFWGFGWRRAGFVFPAGWLEVLPGCLEQAAVGR